MRIAITREVSPAFAHCELTHLPREPIDVERARAQHRKYESHLSDAGFAVLRLPADASFPESVFVEDAALVFEQVAVVTRPGAEARRGEIEPIAEILARLRAVVRIEAPATLDGGDVLTAGRKVYVGQSSRTNVEALRQLREILHPLGYSVEPVSVTGCLHLKSAATVVGPSLLLVNPAWIPEAAFEGLDRVEDDPGEPGVANAVRLGESVLLPADPREARSARRHGALYRRLRGPESGRRSDLAQRAAVALAPRVDPPPESTAYADPSPGTTMWFRSPTSPSKPQADA